MKCALLLLFVMPFSYAAKVVTHSGKVISNLVLVESNGKTKNIGDAESSFVLDWATKECEIRLRKETIPCKLDTSQDLKNDKGELVVKAMPQVVFSGESLDKIYKLLARSDKMESKVKVAVDNTLNSRLNGMMIPFYTCGDCNKTGKDLLLYNAFQSYVTRTNEIQDASLGNQKLVLKLTLKNLKAYIGAFQIIGSNNQGNF